MTRKLAAATLWLCSCMAVLALPVQLEAAKPLTVLEYLGDRASRLAEKLPDLPENLEAWQRRRQQVRAQLTSILGLPQRTPMRAAVTKTVEKDGLVTEDVLYLWHRRAYVSANVVRPKQAAGRMPAIVMPPGWVGRLDQSIYKDFVYHMARKGYLLIFIDDPHVGPRRAGYSGLYGIASASGTQVMGVQVFDTLRGLDYLLTRADVDPGRIGISGLCQGSEQTWLAAALEDRFKVVSPVCGTTTYEQWARMPAFLNVTLSDPSPYVERVVFHTDWHEIGACIAPRPLLIASNSGDNWWPKLGFDKVVKTLKASYAAYGAAERFDVVLDLRSHSMTPFIPEIDPWFEKHLKPLPSSDAKPLPCGKPADPDFSMIRYFQRRVREQSAGFPKRFDSPAAWQAYRKEIVAWLAEACDVGNIKGGPATVGATRTGDGIRITTLDLPLDEQFVCPAVLYEAHSKSDAPKPAVILSHHSEGCTTDQSVAALARGLAQDGFVVLVPEHASLNKVVRRRLHPKFQSANFISLYGVSDTVGLPPMALRVWDDLRCVEYLCKRPSVDKKRILIAGMGVGGVDGVMAAVLDQRIAAAAVVGASTVRDWAEKVAPAMHLFDRIMPYLPGITTKTDLQYLYAAVAPRPLLLIDATDRKHWPESGFQRVKETAGGVYELLGATEKFTATVPRSPWGRDQLRDWATALRSRR